MVLNCCLCCNPLDYIQKLFWNSFYCFVDDGSPLACARRPTLRRTPNSFSDARGEGEDARTAGSDVELPSHSVGNVWLPLVQDADRGMNE